MIKDLNPVNSVILHRNHGFIVHKFSLSVYNRLVWTEQQMKGTLNPDLFSLLSKFDLSFIHPPKHRILPEKRILEEKKIVRKYTNLPS